MNQLTWGRRRPRNGLLEGGKVCAKDAAVRRMPLRRSANSHSRSGVRSDAPLSNRFAEHHATLGSIGPAVRCANCGLYRPSFLLQGLTQAFQTSLGLLDVTESAVCQRPIVDGDTLHLGDRDQPTIYRRVPAGLRSLESLCEVVGAL